MSSDNKKVFTTEGVFSKSAGQEVISDTVAMPDNTGDYVLSAKTDSSCVGQVDIELEMSPDGTNWCPAVTRTVSVTSGTSTSAVTGNEEYVKLTPDAGEFKNKHARGGLNFDVNGAVVTPDGSGARDLMHQHISVNKSFNYSQWFKTSEQPSSGAAETVTFAVTVSGGVFNIDGSAQPTLSLKEGSTYTFDQSDASNSGHPLKFSTTSNGTHGGGTEYTTGVTYYGTPGSAGAYTQIVVAASAPTLYYYCSNHSGMGGTAETPVNNLYKPVLFRHGGYDNFSNAKTVELTDGPSAPNVRYLPTTTGGTPAPGLYSQTTFTNNKGWFPTYDDSTRTGGTAHWWTQTDSAISFWHKGDKSQTSGQVIMYQFYHDHGAPFASTDTWKGQFQVYFHGNYLYIVRGNKDYVRSGSWSHAYAYFNVTSVNATDWHHYVINIPQNASLFTAISNSTLTIDNGTALNPGTGGSGYDPDSAALTVVNAGVFSNPPAHSTTPASWTNSPSTYTANIDQLSTWRKSLTSQEISEIYNSGNHFDVTTSSCASYLERHLQFGDHPSDGTSLYDAVSNTSFLDSHNNTDLTANLSSGDSISAQKTTQNLCEPLDGNERQLRASGTAGLKRDYKVTLKQGFTNKNMFNNSNNNMVSWNDTWAISFWGFISNNTYFDATIAQVATGTSGNRLMIYQKDNAWYVSYGGGGHYIDIPSGSTSSYTSRFSHFVIMKTASGVPSASNIAFYANGVKLSTGTPLVSTNNPLTLTQWDNLTVAEIDIFASARSISTSALNVGGTGQHSGFRDTVDQVAFYSGALSDGGVSVGQTAGGQVATVYNSGNYHDLSKLPSSFGLQRYFKCGDGPNDAGAGQSPKTYDLITNELFIEADTSYSATKEYWELTTDPNLTGWAGIYEEAGPITSDVFTTTSNLSISGWFKTTDRGVLFSNTGGAAATGMKMEVNTSDMTLSLLNASQSISVSSDVNDGNWHHIVMTKSSGTSPTFKVYIDGAEVTSTQATNISNDDLKGSNGFTLLNDGQNNASDTSPSSVDNSKLNATLSNWSIHSEVLDQYAVKQLYSNGHVRNIKNLPSVTVSAIEAWWQLADTTNPENDLSGNSYHLKYFKSLGTSAIYNKAIEGIAGVSNDVTNNNTTNSLEVTATSGSHINPFKLSTDSYPNAAALTGGLGFCCQYKMDTMSGNASGYERKNIINTEYVATGTSTTYNITVMVERTTNSSDMWLLVWLLPGGSYSSGNLKRFKWSQNTGLFDGDWHQLIVNVDGSAVSSAANTIKVFLDGVELASTSDGGTTLIDTPYNDLIQTEINVFDGTNVNKVTVLGNDGYGSDTTNNMVVKQYIDNVGFWSGITNSNLTQSIADDLYANDNDLESVTGLTFKSLFLMGDGPNDDETTLKSCDIIQPSSYRALTKQANAAQIRYTVPSTETPYRASSNLSTTDLTTDLVNATGATYVNGTINGNAFTMSLTKSFNFTTNEWVETADQDTALCLSFNGFEEQAEYFALWKCSQTISGSTIDICDGDWHNVILSYRGNNDLSGNNVAEGDTVKFGPGPANSLAFNWAISFDGEPLTAIKDGSGADYIGGLNTLVTDSYSSTTYNVGFAVHNRHIKYETSNTEEEYKPHAQFSSGIHEVTGVDNNNAFQGSVDETSFHSDCWWVDEAGTSVITNTFNQEKPATIYGNTTALTNRGAGTDYVVGKPYPLLDPAAIGSAAGSNQYINPDRYDASTNPNGGLEGWWRWGDTPGDCSITINDVKDHDDSINARDISAFGIVTADRVDMSTQTTPESIYLADRESSTTSGSSSITFPQVVIQNIESGVCNLKQMVSPILKYLRVKFTGAGSCNLGESSTQVQLNYKSKE